MAAVNHSPIDQVRDFVAENPFGSIVGEREVRGRTTQLKCRLLTPRAGLWGVVLTGTFAYLYKRPIPLQLKIIQVSRHR